MKMSQKNTQPILAVYERAAAVYQPFDTWQGSIFTSYPGCSWKKYHLPETNQTEVEISWSARKKVIKDGPTGFTTLFRTRSLKVETSGVAPSGYQLMPAKREQRKFLEISRNQTRFKTQRTHPQGSSHKVCLKSLSYLYKKSKFLRKLNRSPHPNV